MQLIVFVAQEAAAREQGRRNEELHGLMRGLLAEIKERTAGTQADVRTINDKLLESVLAKSVTDAQSTPGGIDYQQLAAKVSLLLEHQGVSENPESEQLDQGDEPPYPPRRPTPDDDRIRTMLRTFPKPDDVGDDLEVLKSLSEKSRSRLRLFGVDELQSRSPHSSFDPALSNAFSGELIERGLIEPIDGYFHPVDNSPLMHLTERGREVARLLTARGDAPPYLEGLDEIRSALADEGPES